MAGRQCDDLIPLTFEERIVEDEERASSNLNKGGEGAVDFIFGAGVEDMNPLPV